jgi:hypothetical protein
MQKRILMAVLLTIACLPAMAVAQCSIGAWVEDPELPKATTKVHKAPSLTSEALADIPFAGDEEDDQAMIEITGYSAAKVDRYWTGWVRISSAVTVGGAELFSGDGWIPSDRVRVNVQTPTNKPAPLYSAPKKGSKRIGTIPTETFVKIVGFNCFGFKVRYNGKVGWVVKAMTCGNPVTTCA